MDKLVTLVCNALMLKERIAMLPEVSRQALRSYELDEGINAGIKSLAEHIKAQSNVKEVSIPF